MRLRPARVVDGAAYRRENPNQRIADRANGINRGNAERLARAARSENPDTKVVKVNNTGSRPEGRPSRRQDQMNNGANNNDNNDRGQRPAVDRSNGNASDNNSDRATRDQRRQHTEQVGLQRDAHKATGRSA
jgi:hypothetical protein